MILFYKHPAKPDANIFNFQFSVFNFQFSTVRCPLSTKKSTASSGAFFHLQRFHDALSHLAADFSRVRRVRFDQRPERGAVVGVPKMRKLVHND